jgi:hypothetical protein
MNTLNLPTGRCAPEFVSDPVKYIDKLETLAEAAHSLLLKPYPACHSIDGHGTSGQCDCNDHERQKRKNYLKECIIEVRRMQS